MTGTGDADLHTAAHITQLGITGAGYCQFSRLADITCAQGARAGQGRLQGAATRSVDSSLWWTAGGKPMLVISGLQDTIAPPADTIDWLEAELGDQVTAVRINGAGHALLPEVPDQLAGEIKAWLADLAE